MHHNVLLLFTFTVPTCHLVIYPYLLYLPSIAALSLYSNIVKKQPSIIKPYLNLQHYQWEAKAPVPSDSFREIVRKLIKLHSDVFNLWPISSVQVSLLIYLDADIR